MNGLLHPLCGCERLKARLSRIAQRRERRRGERTNSFLMRVAGGAALSGGGRKIRAPTPLPFTPPPLPRPGILDFLIFISAAWIKNQRTRIQKLTFPESTPPR